MLQTAQTKQLLQQYYKNLANKSIDRSSVGSGFKFVGADITDNAAVIGKDAFIKLLQLCFRRFVAMRVTQMLVVADQASVIVNYDLVFPNGKKINANVAEFWTVRVGKLQSLQIYYDTLTFSRNLP